VTEYGAHYGEVGGTFRSCVRSVLRVELPGAVAAMAKPWGEWETLCAEVQCYEGGIQYLAFVGLVVQVTVVA
jgi:hypothetical protein